MKLRVYPDPILTKVSEPVTDFAEEFQVDGAIYNLNYFCGSMHDVMNQNDGAGLSAVQVGLLKRIVVMQCPKPDYEKYTFINPEIRDISLPLFRFSEGCLSIPGFFDDRDRYSSILLRYEDLTGEVHIKWFHGVEAFCIQHEIDHLDGRLFIDDLSPLKKDRIRKKIEKTLRRK